MSRFPSFADFYRAANGGRSPFPWQERLATTVRDKGWPAEIGVPTGLGKTACIDVAVWALAADAAANGPQRSAPTRIWYVVNRRLLVDAAWEHGTRLATLLRHAAHDGSLQQVDDGAREALAAVAEALQGAAAMGTDWGPLHVTRLRGGTDLGARVPDPSQPALIFATVPMFASRWLFRGYGSSTSMRPVDAALAGIDSLVLLDEAHLARPLRDLAHPLAECDPGDSSLVVPTPRARPVLVSMTATGEATDDRFDLDDEDREHPVIRERLAASKPVALRPCTTGGLAQTMADEAVGLLRETGQPTSCVVFANSPRTARAVFERLKSHRHDVGAPLDLVLLTGLQREREAALNRGRILDETRGAPAGRVGPREHHLVAVATQTLEVGADVDFDHIVTETAGVRAIIQRFGRFNRLGRTESPSGVLCHPEDSKESSLYGTEPAMVWKTLQATASEAPIEMGTGHIAELMGPPTDEPDRVGTLLPNHLWEWAKTSFSPPGEAPVEIFFQGFEEDKRVSILWRSYMPAPNERLVPPVSGEESVEVPIGEARKALDDIPEPLRRRLGPDGVTVESLEPTSLRPGDVVILHSQAGMYDLDGWNPGSREPVLDTVPLDAGVLVLQPEAVRNLAPKVPSEILGLVSSLAEGEEGIDEDELLSELVTGLAEIEPHPWIDAAGWETFLASLRTSALRRPIDGPAYLEVPRPRASSAGVRADAFDELSVTPTSAKLHDHLATVGAAARRIASALGCPQDLCAAVEMAGQLHDLGKADVRFQRWLSPDAPPPDVLAKSGMRPDRWPSARIASGWPRGGRHEELSARVASSLVAGREDADLILHLVISHHGFGRPHLRPVSDPFPSRLSVAVGGVSVVASGNLSEVDWDQPARFRALTERFGYWGLTLLEAIVRQADHAASKFLEVI